MESRPRLSTITSVTTHFIIRIVHIHFHRSHPSALKYLHSTQTDNEHPQSTIKDITAKSNNRQDLGNKIRYLKSQASYESVLSRKLKQGSYYSRINYFRRLSHPEKIDPSQFDVTPKSSTLHALVILRVVEMQSKAL